MIKRLPFLIITWLLVDIYFYQAVITVFHNHSIWWGYWLFESLLAAIVLIAILGIKRTEDSSRLIFGFFSLMLLSLTPKLLATPFLLIEDLVRIVVYGIRQVMHATEPGSNLVAVNFPGRTLAVSEFSIGIALLLFLSLIYGILNGRYNYRVHHISLKFKDLPEAFHKFTLTQLSDIHSGSLTNKKAVERGIALANKQNSDLMLFTGDLVNNKATEMDRWKESFSMLKARNGKYSVLGNHDYGDYMQWENESDKESNLQQLKNVHGQIGFRLLLNEQVKIEKNGAHISLIGVENWGKGSFAKHGDLKKAARDVNDKDFKILMSHDPSHWDAEVLPFDKHIDLTLSGHTHGMQFGVEFPFFKWSPIKYIYPQWAGIYHKKDKYLYVNRGFGFLGYPGRVGILPEITVITLLRA